MQESPDLRAITSILEGTKLSTINDTSDDTDIHEEEFELPETEEAMLAMFDTMKQDVKGEPDHQKCAFFEFCVRLVKEEGFSYALLREWNVRTIEEAGALLRINVLAKQAAELFEAFHNTSGHNPMNESLRLQGLNIAPIEKIPPGQLTPETTDYSDRMKQVATIE